MNIIDKNSILEGMKQRLSTLQERHERDFSGGVQSDMFAIRELKVWIGKIERGEHDAQIWVD
jgi:hypothetical protein